MIQTKKLQFRQILIKAHKSTLVHYPALLLLVVWCVPYITSGSKIEFGDFSFFSQAYEAIRISIVEYRQFPWWNPWIAGGVPLYANPQIGVFSLQTILVIPFGTILGLKISAIIYTFLGYFSMFILSYRYFKIPKYLSSILSLLWVFSSFFVSHLPSHFTFFWFLLAPFYIYKSLTIKTKRDGIWFGVLYAVMALSMVHNAFFHISVLCGVILVVRLLRERSRELLQSVILFVLTTLLIAGHRITMTLENVSDFPRIIVDNASSIGVSVLSPLIPYVRNLKLGFFSYPTAPWGWGEQTASLGIFFTVIFFIGLLYLTYHYWIYRHFPRSFLVLMVLLALCLLFFVIGMGSFNELSPYSLLKKLPLFSETRVSPRWFIWLNLCMLLFIGSLYRIIERKQSFLKFLIIVVCCLGVLELFIYNIGYQGTVLNRDVVVATENTKSFTFVQQNLFGETKDIINKQYDIDSNLVKPEFYREFEATTFNVGVLRANDALADLNTRQSPRCSWVESCGIIVSGNAFIESWTPNKFVIKRTNNGVIEINSNNSNYFIINDARSRADAVSKPYEKFILEDDGKDMYTIVVSPDNSPTHLIKTLLRRF
jgi:hypothetical protein